MNKTYDPKDLIEEIVNALNASSHCIETNTLNSIEKSRKSALKKMKKGVKPIIVFIALLTIAPATGCAAGDKRPKHGPPPEAIQACKDKQAGDSVEFTGRKGELLEATCKEIDGQLVAVPEGMPHSGGRPR